MLTITVADVSEERKRQIEPLIGSILTNASLPNLTFGRTCAHVLLESTRILAYKKEEQNVLSTTTVFLTALLIARRLAAEGQIKRDTDISGELSRLQEWGTILRGEYGNQFDRLVNDYFKEIPVPDKDEFEELPAELDYQRIQFGRGFLRNIEMEAQSSPISITRLLLQFVDDKDSGIAERVQEHHLEELINALRTASIARGGRMAQMYREAEDDELALGVHDYAVALATILRAAKGEFTFALFGPWGSGKTTLTRLLKPLLRDPTTYQEMTAAPPEYYSRRRYEVAFHNAWKYRTPPEAWIYAYKSLADKAFSDFGWLGRILLSIRTSYYSNGQWPIVGALLTLAVVAIPLTAAVQLAVIVGSLIGSTALLHMAAITTTVSSKVQELFTKHIRLSSADDKLGMLALVGDDIRSLLAAWTSPLEGDPDDGPAERFPSARLLLPVCILALVAVAWTVGLLGRGIPPTSGWFPQWRAFDLLDLLPLSWIEAYRGLLAMPTPLAPSHGEWLVLLLWCVLAFVLVVLPWMTKAGRPNRILMVVDDLDRCSPEEMLDVIEGMKLLVDDPAVSKRLQVLMLVDESVLNHAISLRYARMIEERVGAASDADIAKTREVARQEVVAEQNEKLFACHLRIAHLGDADVAAVVARLSGRELEVMRQEQRRIEQQRLTRQRGAAQKAADKAINAANAAEALYNSIQEGKPERLIDQDAPSRIQPPMKLRMMLGGDFMPPSPYEVEQRKIANAQIARRNSITAKKTPEERLEEHPHIVRSREETAKVKEQKKRYLDALGPQSLGKLSEKKEPLFESSDVRFTSDEVDQLQRFIPAHLRSIGRRASPRAVRMLLFQIQLCRLLLQLRLPGRPAQARSIEAILTAFERASKPAAQDADSETVAMARQVI